MMARLVRSSATSATTAPSRRSTTTCRDGKDNKIDVSKVDVSMDGIELEDREFIAAIKEKREPNGSLQQLLPCMHVLGKLEKIIDPQRKAHA